MNQAPPAVGAGRNLGNPRELVYASGIAAVAIPLAIAIAVFLAVLWKSDPSARVESLEAAGTWVGSIAVVLAGSVAVYQLIDARAVNLATTFFEMMSRYQDDRLQKARALVLTFGDGKTPIGPDVIGDPEQVQLLEACLIVCRFYELIGTLVRYRGLQFWLVNSYLHTRVIAAYARLRPFIAQERLRDPDAWRYFEYLALRCIAKPDRHDNEYAKWVSRQHDESVQSLMARR